MVHPDMLPLANHGFCQGELGTYIAEHSGAVQKESRIIIWSLKLAVSAICIRQSQVIIIILMIQIINNNLIVFWLLFFLMFFFSISLADRSCCTGHNGTPSRLVPAAAGSPWRHRARQRYSSSHR